MKQKSKVHFISGLPRSGSTLLAAILKQNPKFVAGMTSPVSTIFRSMEDATAKKMETSVFVTDEMRDEFLKGSFSIYYGEQWNDKTIFDTSRMWCARLGILCRLFPDAKFICCVREVQWIMDSFERLYQNNSQKPSAIYSFDTGGTVYSRTNSIANSSGVVGYAIDALREAYASDYSERILIVDYENLCKNPEAILQNIYMFIGEDAFEHNFKDVQYEAGEFDKQLGVQGLHDVASEVIWKPRKSILPFDLFNRFVGDNFWKRT